MSGRYLWTLGFTIAAAVLLVGLIWWLDRRREREATGTPSWPSVHRRTLMLRVLLVLSGASWPPIFVIDGWPWLLAVEVLLISASVAMALALRSARRALDQRVEHAIGGFVSWGEIENDSELCQQLDVIGVRRVKSPSR